MCPCAIGCQHSTHNRLFGCFPGMTSSLAKSKQIIGAQFQTFFSTIFLCFYVPQYSRYSLYKRHTTMQQFTLTTKKSLHIIFKVTDRVPSKELRERLGIDDIILVLQQNRLWWYGHMLRKEDTDWVKKCMEYEVEGSRPKGWPKRAWTGCAKRLSST